MTNYALHTSSFQETYTERVLNVSRPQVYETGLDPDVYLNETNYQVDQKASSHANNNSYLLLQRWDNTKADEFYKLDFKSSDDEKELSATPQK